MKNINRITIIFFVLFLLNCGKRGPLRLDPEVLPEAIGSLEITQVGETLRLQVDLPEYLSDKKTRLETDNIKKLLVYHAQQSIPYEKFRKKSTLLLKLKPEELSGEHRSYLITIPFKKKSLGKKTHYFSLLYYYGKKRSPLSQIGSFTTRIPPQPISDLAIIKEKKLIKLKWSKPTLNLAEQPLQGIAGYNIYRKIEEVPDPAAADESPAPTTAGKKFKKLNEEAVLVEYFEDTDTSSEGNYYYQVSTALSGDIESDPSNVVTGENKDIYPPDVPANLVSFRARDHMFLTWEKVGDKDLSHYRVYRKSAAEGEFQLIADNVTDNFYKDKDTRRGRSYFYAVSAVDARGNESETSKVASETF